MRYIEHIGPQAYGDHVRERQHPRQPAIDQRGLPLNDDDHDRDRSSVARIAPIGYTTADLRATVDALYQGAFGDFPWVEIRRLAEGARAFQDLDEGKTAAAKFILLP